MIAGCSSTRVDHFISSVNQYNNPLSHTSSVIQDSRLKTHVRQIDRERSTCCLGNHEMS